MATAARPQRIAPIIGHRLPRPAAVGTTGARWPIPALDWRRGRHRRHRRRRRRRRRCGRRRGRLASWRALPPHRQPRGGRGGRDSPGRYDHRGSSPRSGGVRDGRTRRGTQRVGGAREIRVDRSRDPRTTAAGRDGRRPPKRPRARHMTRPTRLRMGKPRGRGGGRSRSRGTPFRLGAEVVRVDPRQRLSECLHAPDQV